MPIRHLFITILFNRFMNKRHINKTVQSKDERYLFTNTILDSCKQLWIYSSNDKYLFHFPKKVPSLQGRGGNASMTTDTATTGIVFPAGMIELGKALYDVSEDELRALRRIVPSWSENGLHNI